MIFVFLGILAIFATGSTIYAVSKIVQDTKVINRLQARREAEKIELIKEISTCVKNLQNDSNPETLKTLQGIFRYFKEYY